MYLHDVLTVRLQLADVFRDRGCEVGAWQVRQGGLKLRFEACDGAIDAGDLTERPSLDAVVAAEALEGGCRDAQSLDVSTGIYIHA